MKPISEVLELCCAVQDDSLTREQLDRFEQRIANDPEARRVYIEIVQLQLLLELSAAWNPEMVEAVSRRNPLISLRWILPLAAGIIVALGAVAWLALQSDVILETPQGRVAVLRCGQVILPGERMNLRPGDVVRTAANSEARVQWKKEATRLDLKSDTEIHLISVKQNKRLVLSSGTLVAEVAKQSIRHPMILETRQGQVQVVGTRFELSTSAEKTRVEVFSGRILLADASQPNGRLVAARQVGELNETGQIKVENLPAAKTIAMGLLAHWRLNEGGGSIAHDTSGNARNASIQNAAWTTTDGQTALVFPPHNQKLPLPGQEEFLCSPKLGLPPEFTITLWLLTDAMGRPLQTIFSNCDGRPDGNGFGLILHQPAQAARDSHLPYDSFFTFHAGKSRPAPSFPSQALALAPESWHHVAVTVNQRAGQAFIHLDGRRVSKRSLIGQEFNLVAPLFFGTDRDRHEWLFSGQIRDIRVYDRLLEQDEIHLLSQQ